MGLYCGIRERETLRGRISHENRGHVTLVVSRAQPRARDEWHFAGAQRRRRPDTVLAACDRSAQGVMGAASAIEFPT
eukprot:2759572-Rhodomonas_salina.2